MQELNLYAEFNGRTLPASQSINSDKFQVSYVMSIFNSLHNAYLLS